MISRQIKNFSEPPLTIYTCQISLEKKNVTYHDQRLYTFINANKQEKNDSFLNDSTDAEHLCSEKVESPLVTGQK